jgi:hypothetical protein
VKSCPSLSLRLLFALLAVTLVSVLGLGVAKAQTQRLAIVVGNNEGSASRRPLRYAVDDARRMATALQAVGGFRPEDIIILLESDAEALDAALGKIEAKLVAADRDESMLFFYFSGHSDGEKIEMGKSQFLYSNLRERLESSKAQVRIALLDACMSGGIVETKGVSQGPAFDINIDGFLVTTFELDCYLLYVDERATTLPAPRALLGAGWKF